MFASRERGPEQHARSPRTSDPAWSPLIELERLPVDGGSSLYVLHRMTYEPGLGGSLMGPYPPVPSAGGLTETRWITSERGATGTRESFCILTAGIEGRIAQAVFDDPALDAKFPEHPLSLAREARRWRVEQVRIRVLRPAWSDPRAAVDLPDVGYAVVPPPRFSQSIEPGPRGHPYANMSRASFSGTDGLDTFMVHSLPAPLRVRWSSSSRTLTEHVRKLAREILRGRRRSQCSRPGDHGGRGRHLSDGHGAGRGRPAPRPASYGGERNRARRPHRVPLPLDVGDDVRRRDGR